MTDGSFILYWFQWSAIVLYLGVTSGVLYWAYRKPRIRRTRTVGVVTAVALLGLLPGNYVLRAMEQTRSRTEFEKYREAAHFKKRCDTRAGELINRTVKDVDGVLLLRPRKAATEGNLRDQYWMGDPYGHDSMRPDSEIRNYLRYLNENDVPVIRPTSHPGYRYVETASPQGVFMRFELSKDGKRIVGHPIDKASSKYAVTWEDISTQEDRQFWVAGGRLQVIVPDTGEILGERVGYLIEPQFGSQRGGRRPWLHARLTASEFAACPPFRAKSLLPINRLFVEKVLKPAQRNADGK